MKLKNCTTIGWIPCQENADVSKSTVINLPLFRTAYFVKVHLQGMKPKIYQWTASDIIIQLSITTSCQRLSDKQKRHHPSRVENTLYFLSVTVVPFQSGVMLRIYRNHSSQTKQLHSKSNNSVWLHHALTYLIIVGLWGLFAQEGQKHYPYVQS
jgi:hypothetical protein